MGQQPCVLPRHPVGLTSVPRGLCAPVLGPLMRHSGLSQARAQGGTGRTLQSPVLGHGPWTGLCGPPRPGLSLPMRRAGTGHRAPQQTSQPLTLRRSRASATTQSASPVLDQGGRRGLPGPLPHGTRPQLGPGCFYQVVAPGRDDFRGPGVPYDQVSIRAQGHSPLPWVKVEDFGSIRAGYSNKLILIHFP